MAETSDTSAGPAAYGRVLPGTGNEDIAARVERWAGWVPYAVLVYFAIQTVLRLAISENLEIDEAEIARHGIFALGYGNSNPPLYDWIVVSLWKLTGSWPAALALAKNGLLASAYLLFYWSGRIVFGTKAGAATLTLSLLLMPQILWHSQITLSHSTAAVTASAATIAVLMWLLDRQTTIRFVVFGLALAATLLSKYSSILLILALVGAVLTIAEARRRLLDWRLLLSGAIAVIIAAPHFIWVLRNLQTSTARLAKLETLDELWSRFDVPVLGIDGLLTTMTALLTSVWPLAILWMVARWVSRDEPDIGKPMPVGTLFNQVSGRALAIGFTVLAIAVLAADVHHTSDRYLTQFLLLLPFWLGLQFPLAFRPRAVRRFLLTGLVLAVAMTVAWPQLALFGKHRFAYPYDTIATDVTTAAGPDAAILMDRPDYATNIVLRMPAAHIFERGSHPATIAVLWDTSYDRSAALIEQAGSCYRLDGPARQIVEPFHYFSGNEARISLVVLRYDATATTAQGNSCLNPPPISTRF